MRTYVRMTRRTPPPRGPRAAPIQLELGAADRLAALIEASGEPLAPERAAGALLALPHVPGELARRVLEEVVRTMRGSSGTTTAASGLVGLAPPPSTPLAEAVWTVVDLETTGVGASARIVEIGAVRVERGEQAGTLSRLVDPGIPMPPRITQITGIRDRDLAGAGPLRPALAELLRACTWQRARRPQRGLRRRHARPRPRAPRRHAHRDARARHGRARTAAAGRPLARFDLASVSDRFDVTVRPCHRALPDALATAEVLLGLIGLAQERGAESAEDVMALALAAPRRARQRRYLAAGLPTAARRLRHARPSRPGALRRQGGRPAHARALVLRFAPPAAAHRGRAGGAGRDRRGAHRIGARGGARRARSDPPLAAAGQRARRAARQGRLPAAGAGRACAGARPAHGGARRRRTLRRAVPVSPAGNGGGRGAARRLPAAHVQAALAGRRRPVPARRGGSLPGALPRRRRRARVLGSARALAAWLAGEEACSTRRCGPASRAWSQQQRYEDAARTTRLLDAVRRADAQVSTIRRARHRTGVLLASDLDPRHVVAFAVVRGALVGQAPPAAAGRPGARARRRRGRPGAGASTPPRRSSRVPRAPGCPRSAIPRRCCSHRPSPGARPGWCPIACTAPDALALRRVAAARGRVPVRAPLPPGRHPRAEELAAVA